VVGVVSTLRGSKLMPAKKYTNIPENWLKFEVLDLIKYPK
jgi:hypothetical protein